MWGKIYNFCIFILSTYAAFQQDCPHVGGSEANLSLSLQQTSSHPYVQKLGVKERKRHSPLHPLRPLICTEGRLTYWGLGHSLPCHPNACREHPPLHSAPETCPLVTTQNNPPSPATPNSLTIPPLSLRTRSPPHVLDSPRTPPFSTSSGSRLTSFPPSSVTKEHEFLNLSLPSFHLRKTGKIICTSYSLIYSTSIWAHSAGQAPRIQLLSSWNWRYRLSWDNDGCCED